MVLRLKNTLLITALFLIIHLLEINIGDVQTQSSSVRGGIYDYGDSGTKRIYRPSSLLRLESYPENLESQNLQYDSSEYVIDKDMVRIGI